MTKCMVVSAVLSIIGFVALGCAGDCDDESRVQLSQRTVDMVSEVCEELEGCDALQSGYGARSADDCRDHMTDCLEMWFGFIEDDDDPLEGWTNDREFCLESTSCGEFLDCFHSVPGC